MPIFHIWSCDVTVTCHRHWFPIMWLAMHCFISSFIIASHFDGWHSLSLPFDGWHSLSSPLMAGTACSGFTLPHWCLYISLLMQLFCNNNHLHITECILTINHHHLYSIDYCLSCDHPSKSSICILVTVPTPVYKYTTVQEVFCAKPRPFYSPTYTSLC